MSDVPMIRLRGESSITGVSWRGKWYQAFNGQVSVPAEAEAELTGPAHRFVRVAGAPLPTNVSKIAKRAR